MGSPGGRRPNQKSGSVWIMLIILHCWHFGVCLHNFIRNVYSFGEQQVGDCDESTSGDVVIGTDGVINAEWSDQLLGEVMVSFPWLIGDVVNHVVITIA